MSTGPLDPLQRRRALAQLADGTVDVLVVGGGVVGAGAALDAATRGLTVGIVEQGDWAGGTSSRSSRLAHGGLRYLEHGEFGLVHEALAERGLLLERLAPHLVRPVRFVFPLTKGWERPYVGAGVALYDVLARFGAGGGTLPGHRHLTRRAALRMFPALDPGALVGALTFFDAQIDDARHTLATVRTAVAHGALAASRVQVTGFRRDGDRVVGVQGWDRLAKTPVALSARTVVAATGVWGARTRTLLDGDTGGTVVTPSKGVHLVVPRRAIDGQTALIARTSTSVLFLLPWGANWLVGTTDTIWHGSLDVDQSGVEVDRRDVDFLLTEANRWLRTPLTHEDVVGVYAGLRPLVTDADVQDTTKVSREHVVSRLAPGLVSVAGGKYTTYRVMASDVVDAAVAELPEMRRPGPSRTAGVPLVGAEGFPRLWEDRHRLTATHRLPLPVIEHLLRRHGDQTTRVLALLDEAPELAEPVVEGAAYLAAEIVHAAAEEGPLTVDDVMNRRTRLGTEVPDGARPAATAVAELMAGPLGWDRVELRRQVAAYQERPPAWGDRTDGVEHEPSA
ncbi:MAG: glycerol-3-phosphate dehydrogenase/oxidase [Actinomycetota bacterium]|nr:glycerol-3-phosphate dehydrogenase/oxidase [Actinomycetota bacterium]MDH4352536.1 glycerol-3-phosphate dehydrogenase/oxidase [Actinomycetota bacterium]